MYYRCAQIIDFLAEKLADEYGESYSPRYLRSFRQFYALFPDFDIWKSRFPNLTWTHIYRTLRVGDDTAIRWYLGEASAQMWSVRTLDRNISTQCFERQRTALCNKIQIVSADPGGIASGD